MIKQWTGFINDFVEQIYLKINMFDYDNPPLKHYSHTVDLNMPLQLMNWY